MIPRNVIPEEFVWCIAGGWAACPALATDLDVFVFAGKLSIDVAREQLVAHLKDEYGDYSFSEQDDNRIQLDQYEHLTVQIRKVGYVDGYGVPIHVCVTTAQSVPMLIDGFDISTHAVAITSFGRVIKSENYTPPQERPRIVHMTTTSVERLRKISERFGHPTPLDIADPTEVIA